MCTVAYMCFFALSNNPPPAPKKKKKNEKKKPKQKHNNLENKVKSIQLQLLDINTLVLSGIRPILGNQKMKINRVLFIRVITRYLYNFHSCSYFIREDLQQC